MPGKVLVCERLRVAGEDCKQASSAVERDNIWHCRELAREMGVLGDKATALDEWRFKNGARLVSRGVGSAPTGINPISLLVCDDPIKDRKQASSAVERDNIWQWWQGSIIQRFWPRTRAVVIATRWHEDDLIGRLKASGDDSWTFINLPAIAQENDPLGRMPGEALWPEAKPLAFLEKQRAAMGDYEFEAVFQGNPTPREGSFFKVDRFGFVDAAPKGYRTVRRWDNAATAGSGDYTVGVKMTGPTDDGRFVVLGRRFCLRRLLPREGDGHRAQGCFQSVAGRHARMADPFATPARQLPGHPGSHRMAL
jgi:hypothetical protein